jgi:hypothetical protein
VARDERAELVKDVIESLMPLLSQLALTPEKVALMVQEMKKPYIDPAVEARKLRERKEMARDIAAGLVMKLEAQKRCPHRDKNSWKINPVNNHPDGRVRGVCMACQDWFQPKHWEIMANGEPVLVDAHPLYHIVVEIDESTVAPYVA